MGYTHHLHTSTIRGYVDLEVGHKRSPKGMMYASVGQRFYERIIIKLRIVNPYCNSIIK